MNETQRSYQPVCPLGVNNNFWNVVYVTVMIVILIMCLVGNVLVIVATYLSKALRSRVTSYFIVSLAFADMLLAIVQIPIKCSKMLYRRQSLTFCHGLGTCYWFFFGDSFSTIAAFFTLLTIAIDRFVAIRFPFKHPSFFTKFRSKMIIFGIWIYALVYGFTGLFNWEKEKFPNLTYSIMVYNEWCESINDLYFFVGFIINYLVPLSIMTFIYLMILKIAIEQIRAIESTKIEIEMNGNSQQKHDNGGKNSKTSSNAAITKKEKEKRLRNRELKATKSVFIVYFTFLLCWLPTCIHILFSRYDKHAYDDLRKNHLEIFEFIYFFFYDILPMLHTMLNPIIYSFSNKLFRNSFKSVCQKIGGNWSTSLAVSNNSNSNGVTRMSFSSRSSIASNVPEHP